MWISFPISNYAKVLTQSPQRVPALGDIGVGESYLTPDTQCPQNFHDDSGVSEVGGRPVCWMVDAVNIFLISCPSLFRNISSFC